MTETAQLGDDVACAPLAGRRALVTGGSRGIGAGIVRRLAADGAAVALTYREVEGPANDLQQEIVGSGGSARAVQADSADPEALRAAIAETVGRFGGLEVLVNNAGTSHHAPIEEFPMAEYDRLLAVNVRAIFVAIQAALPHLGTGGRIITIGSVLADRAPSLPDAAKILKRINEAFKAKGVRKHALNKRSSLEDGRLDAWFTYPTAVMASEALDAFRAALAEHDIEVEKQVREMAVPRQWS